MTWSKKIDDLFDAGELVSFASLAEASRLDQEFEAKRNADVKMDRLKIEPKKRPDKPIEDDHSLCQRTISRIKQIKARWKMDGLQLVGESTEQEKLSDAEMCERFNNRTRAVATVYQSKPVKLYYELTR